MAASAAAAQFEEMRRFVDDVCLKSSKSCKHLSSPYAVPIRVRGMILLHAKLGLGLTGVSSKNAADASLISRLWLTDLIRCSLRFQVILSDDGDQPYCAKPCTPNDAFNKLAMVLQYLCSETQRLRKHVSRSTDHLRLDVFFAYFCTIRS